MLLGLQDSINKTTQNVHISFAPDYVQYACRKEPTEYIQGGSIKPLLRFGGRFLRIGIKLGH